MKTHSQDHTIHTPDHYVNTHSPGSMIHHNDKHTIPYTVIPLKRRNSNTPNRSMFNHYGVSSYSRVITRGQFIKKYDLIRDCLKSVLGLHTAEREAVLRLLKLFVWYGAAYPKAAQLCQDPGCSRATFWRAVGKLRHLGLIVVVNRFLTRPHAQISNLYNLINLIVVIARYLAEHGQAFTERWIKPFLRMPGRLFWPGFGSGQLSLFTSASDGVT